MYPFCMSSTTTNTVLLSDSVARESDGALVGSQTDSYKGGEVKTWEGTAGTVTVIAAQAYARSPGNAFHSTTVNAGSVDVSMTVEIAELPTMTSTAVNATLDFRKAAADSGDCYRLAIRGDGNGGGLLRLCKRISGTVTLLGTPDVAVKVGDKLRVVVKGSIISVFVNGRQQLSTSDTGITSGNFYGFSSATSTTANAYGFRNIVISQA